MSAWEFGGATQMLMHSKPDEYSCSIPAARASSFSASSIVSLSRFPRRQIGLGRHGVEHLCCNLTSEVDAHHANLARVSYFGDGP
jgi:hypothetical protein